MKSPGSSSAQSCNDNENQNKVSKFNEFNCEDQLQTGNNNKLANDLNSRQLRIDQSRTNMNQVCDEEESRKSFRDRSDHLALRKANNAKLSRLLESNKRDVHSDDDKSGRSGQHSLDSGSWSSGGSGRNGLLRILQGRSTRSLDEGTTRHDGIFKQHPSDTKLKTTRTRTLRNGAIAQDLQRNLRNDSAQRTMNRLMMRRSLWNDSRPNELHLEEDEGEDISERTEATFMYSTDGESSSLVLELTEKSGLSSEHLEEDDEEHSFGQLTTTIQASQESPSNLIPKPEHHSLTLVPSNVPEERPKLRRTMSTPSLKNHESAIRSILKKSDALSSTQPRTKSDASVRFDFVEMREFDRTIGDNPSVSRGVPIGLDWKYNPQPFVQKLDDYETDRLPRRHRGHLALTPMEREVMLSRDWGVSFKELQQTALETDFIRFQRRQSASQNVAQQRREEILETTKRRLVRAFQGGKKRELGILRDLGVGESALKPIASISVDPIALNDHGVVARELTRN